MARMCVEIDMAQLARVREVLGTQTVEETIRAAFREVMRAKAAENLIRLAQDGAFSALLAPDVEQHL
jgi:Arc/MetJ family transcription regulator